MNRINFRIFIGGALVLLGVLMLLQRFNIFSGAVDIFWGAIFLVGGVYFLYRFASDMRSEWWALIPGFALIGVGTSIVRPGQWSGFSFLGFLGISFLRGDILFNRLLPLFDGRIAFLAHQHRRIPFLFCHGQFQHPVDDGARRGTR